ncbi:MAG: hypothetical protein JST11_31005, partial [Acidobacteria bacterium]|nr:hypothetical protein [Acidobacteriota bacterium]
MPKRVACVLAAAAAATFSVRAQPGECNAPTAAASVTIPLPSSPFAVVPARDGCHVFVSLTGIGGATAGIAVLKRSAGRIELSR